MRYWQNKIIQNYLIKVIPSQALAPGPVQILHRVSQLLELRENSDRGENVPNMSQHVSQLPTAQFCNIASTRPSSCPSFVSMATGALLVTAVRLQRTGEPGPLMAPSSIICQKLGFPEGGLSSCQLHLSMPSVGIGESQSVVQMLVIRTEM